MASLKKLIASGLALIALTFALPSMAVAPNTPSGENDNTQIKTFVVDFSQPEIVEGDSNRPGTSKLRNTYLTQTWDDFSELKAPSIIRSISMSMRFYPRRIGVEVVVLSNGIASRIGFSSLTLQRYTSGRWVNVTTWYARYRTNASSFTFRSSVSNLPLYSGSYRLRGNFTAKVGTSATFISRITNTLSR